MFSDSNYTLLRRRYPTSVVTSFEFTMGTGNTTKPKLHFILCVLKIQEGTYSGCHWKGYTVNKVLHKYG